MPFSPGVPEGISEAIEQVDADPTVDAAVIGGGRTFIAGADIKEFGKMTSGKAKTGPGLQPLLLKLEDCPKPVVMAIHGTAFGGGLEMAMACHYRVAVPGAQVGQPEVKLGIIPGAGGTQRLPRLAGVAKALEMCAGGEPGQSRRRARQPASSTASSRATCCAGAVAFAREIAGQRHRARTREPQRQARHRRTPNAAIFAAARDARLPRNGRGHDRSARGHRRGRSRHHAALRPRACERRGRALPRVPVLGPVQGADPRLLRRTRSGQDSRPPEDTPPIPINRRAAVVGAGTMGGGIAMTYANAGIPVLLKEATRTALDRGLATIRKNYASTRAKGRLTQQQMDERLAPHRAAR